MNRAPLAPAPRRMTLGGLLDAASLVARAQDAGALDTPVTGLALDSRLIEKGDLYLALGGRESHGLRHADQALTSGAAAIASDVGEFALEGRDRRALGVPTLEIDGLASHVNALASAFFGAPDQALHLIAVTGTDGKTSVCRFVAEALAARGADTGAGNGTSAGYVGTLGWGLCGANAPALGMTALTTPDAVTLRRMLAALRDAGAVAVALEASSHGLAEGRLDGLAIDVAVLTNLGRDHLDYHGSLEAYGAAKARLFDWPSLTGRVVNADDALGAALIRTARERADGARLARYGSTAPDVDADANTDALVHRALDIEPSARGIGFTLQEDGVRRARIDSPLVGRFNVQNLLACCGVLRLSGIDFDDAARRIAALGSVPGRMERFGGDGEGGEHGPLVIVDYAHTPQALAAAIDAARAHCRGKLRVVFGCGGERDPGKRAPMGAAAEAADVVTITDDNPRGEDSRAIIDAILDGLREPGRATVIADRATAIAHAIDAAGSGDVVLVAGKGHEDYQVIDTGRIDYSDRATVAELLAARGQAPEKARGQA